MRRLPSATPLLLALAACGPAAPGPGNGAAAGPAPGAAPAPGSLASPDGRSEVRTDAQFSGLPAGIPAYPRVNPGGAIQMGGESDGNEMRVMGFRTADTPAQVIAFYADAGAQAGFRVVRRAESGPSTVLTLARDNGDGMNVTATGTPTGTNVQIMAGRERRRR
jgi:hypothetical protein